MSFSGIGSDGKIYCKHMEEAAERTANTSKHSNRGFYCCKRLVGSQTKCDFFLWADEVSPKGNIISASASGLSAVSATLRSPMEGAGTNGRPISASPTRSVQKHSVPLNDSLPETPRSRKRLQDIEAGLRQRERERSPTRHPGPSQEPGPSTSFSGAEAVPQPPSPVPTEVDSEAEAQPGKTFRSFLGLDYSSEPVASTIQYEGQPSTPKKPRLAPPTGESGIQPTADAESSGGGLLLTPPETKERVARLDRHRPTSPIVHSKKGKEREGIPPVQTQDQIAGNTGEPQESDSLPLFTHPDDISSTSSASPTIAENILDYTDGLKARVKALSEYTDSFDITQAAKLLQTVERQKIQYEYRDRSQKMRMEDLAAERDKLVAEVSRLKEALQRSEASNCVKDAEIASLKGH